MIIESDFENLSKYKPDTHFLYKITNIINNKCYIGVTKRLKKRVYNHIKAPSNKLLHAAFNKYGINSFTFQVILIGSKDFIYEMEKQYIYTLNNFPPLGFNLKEGGNPPLILSGVNNPSSKLKESQLRHILESPLPAKELSLEMGVAVGVINNFRAGKTYTDLYNKLSTELDYKLEDKKKIYAKGFKNKKGFDKPNAVLTESKAITILTDTRPAALICKDLGISESVVYSFRAGSVYKELFAKLSKELDYDHKSIKLKPDYGKRFSHEKPWNQKLTEEEIKEILLSSSTSRQLGEQFGVSKTVIINIRNGKAYKGILSKIKLEVENTIIHPIKEV